VLKASRVLSPMAAGFLQDPRRRGTSKTVQGKPYIPPPSLAANCSIHTAPTSHHCTDLLLNHFYFFCPSVSLL
jgi:hypothetical protein